MKRILLIVAGLVGVLVGLGFIMPAVAWWRLHGADIGAAILPLLFGNVLVVVALFAIAKGLRRSHA